MICDLRFAIWLKRAALALLLSTLNVQISAAFAQGSITPPGPPAATMLTLTQVEPRTPISSVPVTIANPGSYYLTANLVCTVSNAVTIAANGVTLDLNGFTISSTVPNAANGGTAILLNSGLSDITICNGHIVSGVTNNGSGLYSGSGFDSGIFFSLSQPVNVLVSHISVSGCLLYGIVLGNDNSTVAESCTVRTIGGYGILASTVKQSLATDCSSDAIYGDQVSDCQGQTTGSTGIYAYTAQNSYGYNSSSGAGINVFGCALNCYGFSNSGDGLVANNAENCFGYCAAGADGLYAYGIANGCVGVSISGTGVDAFIANVCHGDTSTGTPLTATHNVNSY
jgi:hypothetical protein